VLRFIASRILQAIPVLFLIAVVSFGLMQLAPGGPAAQFNQNPHISQEQIDAWLRRWCLEPNADAFGILREFGGWLGVWNCDTQSLFSAQGSLNVLPTAIGGGTNGIVHGDFGYSIDTGLPVLGMIAERMLATFVLMGSAFLIWISIAILIGVIAAVKRYSAFDQGATLFSYLFYSLPTFWLGLVLIYVFAVNLHWFPSQGIVDARAAPGAFNTPAYWKGFWAAPLPQIVDIGRHLVLPVITLVAVTVAADSRFVRTAMLDTLSQDYVRTARAKGMPRNTVIFRHAFRNALLPIITSVTLEIAFLFSGAIVTETIFSWPGMGRLFYDGVNNRDYFLLMGIVFIGSVFVVVMTIVADVFYAIADPRIRY
jgi:peptide/nickel transport system permease protein